MIIFDKPNTLDGLQLIKELITAGVAIVDDNSSIFIDGNDKLVLDIDAKDKSKAQKVIDAHILIDDSQTKELAKAAILDRIGLTADELKTILG